ncbi:MAG TPA: sulfite exporter TauE/SafE family protein [Dehalococcoidia bacterium]|nr:sulfite exporter TauE/SafE family protein [Dehalococcoidia bacterium]
MSPQVLVAGVAIAFLASVCQSVTGFGFALVMVPLITVVWAVKPAVAATVLLSLFGNAMLLREVRGHVSVPRVSGLLAGFAIGLVPGVFIFEKVDEDALRIGVGVIVLIATLLIYRSPEIDRGHDSFGLRVVTGAVSGAIGSSTSLSGPPVVLYLVGRVREIDAFRATILAYFVPSSVIVLISYAIVGQISRDVLVMAAAGAPAVLIGNPVGGWLRGHLDAERFRIVVLAVLVGASFSVVLSTLLR